MALYRINPFPHVFIINTMNFAKVNCDHAISFILINMSNHALNPSGNQSRNALTWMAFLLPIAFCLAILVLISPWVWLPDIVFKKNELMLTKTFDTNENLKIYQRWNGYDGYLIELEFTDKLGDVYWCIPEPDSWRFRKLTILSDQNHDDNFSIYGDKSYLCSFSPSKKTYLLKDKSEFRLGRR